MRTKWTIGKRLILSFMAVAAITLLLGAIGYYAVSLGSASIHEIGSVRLPSVQTLLIISEAQTAVDSAENALLSTSVGKEVRHAQFARFDDAKQRADDAWQIYEPLPQTEEEATLWTQFVPAWNTWWSDHEEFVRIANEYDTIDILDPSGLERDLQQFRGDHYRVQMSEINLIASGAEFGGGDDATACNFGKWMAAFETSNPALQALMEEIRPNHERFHASVKEVKALGALGDKDAALGIIHGEQKASAEKTFAAFDGMLAEAARARASYDQMSHQALAVIGESFSRAEDLLNQVVTLNSDLSAAEVNHSTTQARVLKSVSMIAMVVGAALALALGIIMSRSINNALRRIAASLGSGAEQTASASNQVAQSSQAMAEGASEQASSLEETSASLEEITSMTRQNADNATQARTLAEAANAGADRGSVSMAKMSKAIDDIKSSSDATAKILKSIDEIAFQTNLLALNAAVEAARAGDAGKGFAVVAEEVRNLAQRSAEAARNTAALIEEAVKNAENGVHISREVGASLEEISAGVRKVSTLVDEIASASKEQAEGIDQVNTAVAQMDQVTQANAASSEETASASEELSAQAEEMNRMVQELLALVGGTNSQADHATTSRGAHVSPRSVATHAVSRAFTGSPNGRPALAPRARNTSALPGAPTNGHRGPITAVHAENVLPLDNDDLDGF